MIGREAFDTPEEHLVDLTGMSLADARRFLVDHDGDANAAAETFFLSQDDDVEVDDEDVEDSTTTVEQLFQNTTTMTDEERKRRRPASAGRRLNSSSTSSSSSSTSSAEIRVRTIHVAFFKQSVTFFESIPSKSSSSSSSSRRRGVHTFETSAGPYSDRPDISSWIGDAHEIGRVGATDSNYNQVVSDMHASRVPNLSFFRPEEEEVQERSGGSNTARVQFSLILHDLRESDAPPPPPSSSSSSSSSSIFAGAGNTLGGGSGGSGVTKSKKNSKKFFQQESEGGFTDQTKMEMVAAAFGAVACPLLCFLLLGIDVHLGYSVVGGAVALYGRRWWIKKRKEIVVKVKHVVVNEEMPMTTIKFQLVGSKSRETWTQMFNETHGVQSLHLSVVERLFGGESAEYREYYLALKVGVDEEEEEKKELVVRLRVGFGREKRMLDGFDAKTTLKEAGLLKERVEVLVNWQCVERGMKEIVRKLK